MLALNAEAVTHVRGLYPRCECRGGHPRARCGPSSPALLRLPIVVMVVVLNFDGDGNGNMLVHRSLPRAVSDEAVTHVRAFGPSSPGMLPLASKFATKTTVRAAV
ncbi:MAG TPA: hypothetical protein VMF89_14935 [Polyangiales bacterium]|nr:hypothetical protein [Polyangiales bacterium]